MPIERRTIFLLTIAASLTGGAIWTMTSQASLLDTAVNEENAADRGGKKDAPKKPALAEFMRHKLDHSNDIMEGLLIEDSKMITKAAEKLKKMSDAEEWRVSNDMMYRNHSEDFRRAVDKLIVAAKGTSIDRAALASFDVTLSCIDCHRYVRSVLIAGSE